MRQARLTPTAALLLTVPPLLWAGNAVLGRVMTDMISPLTLNLSRWIIALVLLLPLAGSVLKPSSLLWRNWRRIAVMAMLSVGTYNGLLYIALNTSTAINVTLVASITPVWTLIIGRVFFSQAITRRQWLGALLSIAGVLVVLSRGQWSALTQIELVAGDLYMLGAAAAWAYYSWMLAHPTTEPASIRADWAAFLLAQIVMGLPWSFVLVGGEWALGMGHIHPSWMLLGGLLYIAIGPALLAYRAWGAGVARAGASIAGFFTNLTPLFTALLSSLFLGESPHLYHALAFVMIAGGIVVSAQR
jgi:drug/metabolite transporter (DMT)-like permease